MHVHCSTCAYIHSHTYIYTHRHGGNNALAERVLNMSQKLVSQRMESAEGEATAGESMYVCVCRCVGHPILSPTPFPYYYHNYHTILTMSILSFFFPFYLIHIHTSISTHPYTQTRSPCPTASGSPSSSRIGYSPTEAPRGTPPALPHAHTTRGHVCM